MAEQQQPTQRQHHRYKLMLLSERKDRTVFSFSMPLWVTVMLASLIAVLTAMLVILIVTKTPLGNYLPGYLDVTKRAAVVENAMKVDSLEYENDLRMAYLANLTAILRDKVSLDSIQPFDSAMTHYPDSVLMPASSREAAFVQHYEERERFGVNALRVNASQQGSAFIAPAKGKVLPPAANGEAAKVEGVRLQLLKQSNVLAPLEGTVVGCCFIIGQGWEVTIQSASGYLVTVSRLTQVMVELGDVKRAGSALGRAGGQKDAADSWMSIRIWHKGKSVDPKSVMSFE